MYKHNNLPSWTKIFESDISKFRARPDLAQLLLQANTNEVWDPDSKLFCSVVLKLDGSDAFKEGRYSDALSFYKKAIAVLAGPGLQIPIAHGRSEIYEVLDYRGRLQLIACASNIAQCYSKLDNIVEALDWLSEVEVIFKSQFLSTVPAAFEWMDVDMNVEEWYSAPMKAVLRSSKIFMELGNSGAAVWKAWVCNRKGVGFPEHPTLRKLVDSSNAKKLSELRHPDPSLTNKLKLHHPSIQIQGSWKKFDIAGRIPSRYGAASWVWNGNLYVAGGEKAIDGPSYADVWALNLNNLQAWRKVSPSLGFRSSESGTCYGMAVSDDKAWLFKGSPLVDYFDLRSETWHQISTKFRGRWPYPGNELTGHCVQAFKGHIYIFGGVHDGTPLGCNIFMALNTSTYEWQLLSGTAEPKADHSIPSLRHNAASWLDTDQERLYILYGSADRMQARLSGSPHGAQNSYCLDDFWSYSIPDGLWTREKVVGNVPCPRSEFAGTYNPLLKKAFVFGGYNESLPTYFPQAGGPEGLVLSHSYYADAFSFSPEDGRWSHILTRGFPTYRALMQFISDQDGRMWLFGGHCPSQFAPSRALISRSYSDLWHLRLDLPGGCFEGVDVEEESRTVALGPWRRCFGCSGVGPWRKCAGSCGGKAFFCDTECQRAAQCAQTSNFIFHFNEYAIRVHIDIIYSLENCTFTNTTGTY